MNGKHSHGRWRVAPRLAGIALALLGAGPAHAVLHAEHALRYTGWMGWTPVTVEVTLRERPGNLYEYREWEAPRWWATVLGSPEARQTMMRVAGSDFRPVSYEAPDGTVSLLDDLEPDVFDPLGVRLEARADLAAGRREAAYRVWQPDGSIETWRLEVTGDEVVETPDARYRALTFRLGNDAHWIRGWSAPLVVFHFVKLEFWEADKRVGLLELEVKELYE